MAEVYDIVTGPKNTAIKAGWFKVSDRQEAPTVASNIPSADDGPRKDGEQLAQAEPSAHLSGVGACQSE